MGGLVLLLVAGCSLLPWNLGQETKQPEKPAPAPPPPKPAKTTMVADPTLVGRVVRFNSAGGYAILQFPPGLMATNGAELFVYREGKRVGQVSVNGESRDDRTAADLKDGSCQPGDEVRDR